MSTISLTESTRLEDVPEKRIIVDPRVEETMDRLEELKINTQQTARDYVGAVRAISGSMDVTQRRLSYLQRVHDASHSYWSIVGTAVSVLLLLKVFQGGRATVKWTMKLVHGKDKKQETQSVLQKRLHAREWKVVN